MDCLYPNIDSNVVGWRYAEEECPGILPTGTPAVAATGVLTFDDEDNVESGDAVTIGNKVYTFVSTLADPNDVLIGAVIADTCANLAAAINGGAGEGVVYGVGTNAHGQVTAAVNALTVVLTAKVAGTAGNGISTLSTADTATWGASALAGGAESVGGPVMRPLPPNSFSDYGAQYTRVAHDPIRDDRQREKGSISDTDVSGGVNIDFTNTNLRDMISAFMYADIREKANYSYVAPTGTLSVVTTGDFSILQGSGAVNFISLGLIPGEWIYIGGDIAAESFAEEENNGFKRIRSIAAQQLVLDKSVAPMSTDAGTGKTIRLTLGKVVKNEQRPLIRRRTFAFERTLGSPDGLYPPQSEILKGMSPNQLTINMAQADKLNVDMTFVGQDVEYRTAAQGLLPAERPDPESVDVINMSTDFKRIKLSAISNVDEAPLPIVAYFTEGTLTINNNAEQVKVIGAVGGIGANIGTFEVGGNVTGLFSTIEGCIAVKENWDMTLDMIMVKGATATIYDMPLIGLGDGRPNVEKDQPITLPFDLEGGTAKRLGDAFNYTAMWVFFDNLPNAAKTVV